MDEIEKRTGNSSSDGGMAFMQFMMAKFGIPDKAKLGLRVRDMGYVSRLVQAQKGLVASKFKRLQKDIDSGLTEKFEAFRNAFVVLKSVKWSQALDMLEGRLGIGGGKGSRVFVGLEASVFGGEFVAYANRIENEFGELVIRDVGTKVAKMAAGYHHDSFDASITHRLAALCLFVMSKSPAVFKRFYDLVPAPLESEIQFTKTWLQSIAKNTWRFDDLLRYFSSQTKNIRPENLIALQFLVIRIILASMDPTIELDPVTLSSELFKPLTTKRLQVLLKSKLAMLETEAVNHSQALAKIETTIEERLLTGAFRTDAATGRRGFIGFLCEMCPEVVLRISKSGPESIDGQKIEMEVDEVSIEVNTNPMEKKPQVVSVPVVAWPKVAVFVKQCLAASTDPTHIELALQTQFGTSVANLGFGSLKKIIKKAKAEAGITSFVHSIHALTCGVTTRDSVSVAVTGDVSTDTAVLWLSNVPFLEDAAAWLHWDMIACPVLGPLIEFVERQEIPGFVDVDGKLVRVPTRFKVRRLVAAVKTKDARMLAAWIVAGVVEAGGWNNIASIRWRDEIVEAGVVLEEEDGANLLAECLGWVLKPLQRLVGGVLATVWSRWAAARGVGNDEAGKRFVNVVKSLGGKAWDAWLRFGVLDNREEWILEFKAHLNDGEGVNVKSIVKKNNIALIVNESPVEDSVIEKVIPDDYHLTLSTPTVLETEFEVEIENGSDEECRNIVESIRQKEFGIGLVSNDIGPKGKAVLLAQYGRGCRALQRLSEELYSQDSHFALELLQNADDNKYKSGQIPTIEFVISNATIIVRNNEKGFSEKNIRALCDVGKSTKKKGGAGYIGHKGIGFKSVFRVSANPEIHSNGFHVRFSDNDYIVPQWMDNGLDVSVSKLFDMSNTVDNQTLVVLPLRETGNGSVERLVARLADIQPSLLLFLHRIRKIVVRDLINEHTRIMTRSDIGNNEIIVQSGNQTTRWLVVTKSIQAPPGVTRDGVTSTELSLAFPLDLPADSHPPQQQVFAFLPLRSYGYRFIIQGDFVVPSSREEVDRDSVWNEWLRDEITNLFMTATKLHKNRWSDIKLESKDKARLCGAFLRFVPLDGETTGFFKPVARNIVKQLERNECIYTEGGKFVEPMLALSVAPAVVHGDDKFYEVMNSGLLERALGLFHVHRGVARALGSTAASTFGAIGVRVITVKHVIAVLVTLVDEGGGWSDGWLGRWIEIFEALNSAESVGVEQRERNLERLKSLQFVPLLGEASLVSVDERAVFLTDPNQQRYGEGEFDDGLMAAGRSVLRLIDFSKVVGHQIGVSRSGEIKIRVEIVKAFFEKIGVRLLTAHQVVWHHIVPELEHMNRVDIECGCSSDFAECSCTVQNVMSNHNTCGCFFKLGVEETDYAVRQFECIKRHAVTCTECERENIWSRLRTAVPVALESGVFCILALLDLRGGVYFHRNYLEPSGGGVMDGASIIGLTKISDLYLNKTFAAIKKSRGVTQASVVADWKSFFERLGVAVNLKVEKKVEELTYNEAAQFADKMGVRLVESGDNVKYRVTDWQSAAFERLVRGFEHRYTQSLSNDDNDIAAASGVTMLATEIPQLIQSFDANWTEFKLYTIKQIEKIYDADDEDEERVDIVASKESTFARMLATSTWVLTTSKELHRPCDLFLPTPEIKALLGTLTDYLATNIENPSFVEVLKVRRSVGQAAVIDLIDELTMCEVSDSVSVHQMVALYLFIRREAGVPGLKKWANTVIGHNLEDIGGDMTTGSGMGGLMKKKSLIFVPINEDTDAQFVSIND
ncbi:hypothetical protein HK096_006342, partial [Nowakowskiella sp. JEL0078]